MSATLAATFAPLPAAAQPALSASPVRQLLDAANFKGGLIVHLGCGDGSLTAAMRVNDACVVHGLDANAKNVEVARKRIQSLGLYGNVSVEHWTGATLPYVDNLANLIVVSGDCQVSTNELLRVLVPNGVAIFTTTHFPLRTPHLKKPWPADIDEWSHWQHDAGNNAVAHDTRVGTPRRMQWTVDPLWSRGHEVITSIGAMVTAGGRIFYVLDEGQPSIYSLPSRWSLIARDAFNGVQLWKHPLPEWSPPIVLGGFNNGFQPRRLTTDGARIYLPEGKDATLTVLDAATGQNLKSFPEATWVSDILCSDGLLVAFSSPATGNPAKIPQKGAAADGELFVIRADTLELVNKISMQKMVRLTLALDAGRLFFQQKDAVIALDARSGKTLWSAPCAAPPQEQKGKGGQQNLVVHGGKVFRLSGRTLTAFSAADGQQLWQQANVATWYGELFVVNDRLWLSSDKGVFGFDAATGKDQKTIDVSSVFTEGHHLRCYAAKATDRFVITPNRGAEFISLTSKDHTQNDWVRGNCGEGVIPANGLLYAGPVQCLCYAGVMLNGFKVLAPGPLANTSTPASAPSRFERGPAYDELSKSSTTNSPNAADWPTYRHDAERFGATTANVPATLAPRWQAKLGARGTAPVAADGLVFVATPDTHLLHALSAANGQPAWQFTAGARIDSPPTLHAGLVLFGCADGWVYCLRAKDGILAWRFRAAPAAEKIMACGQIESPWRVHGSILLKKGLAYFTAGRASYLDGGLWLYALEPHTGRIVHQAQFDTWATTREDAVGKPFIPAYAMEGSRSDILVSEGDFVYLGQTKFNLALKEQKTSYVLPGAPGKPKPMNLLNQPFVSEDVAETVEFEKHQREWMDKNQKALVEKYEKTYGGYNLGVRDVGRHVFSTAGFLDDSWYNRSYWMHSSLWPGFILAHRSAKAGQLLVVGPEKTFAVEAFTSRNLQSPVFTPGGKGYLLFADRNETEPALPDETIGTPKGWGFTRSEPPAWFQWVPVRIRAMVQAGPNLFVAGPPDVAPADDPMAAFDGRKGAVLWAYAAADGKKLAEYQLDAPPVFDGLIAAQNQLFLTTADGKVMCFGSK